jgi:hypothetical protein
MTSSSAPTGRNIIALPQGQPTGNCKCCGDEVVRVYKKLQRTSGNKLYVDDKGRYWKGQVCAGCQANKRRHSYVSKKDTEGPEGT